MSTIDGTPIPCKELVELVTDYLDGVLPSDLRDRFRQHLDGCDGCTEYVRQIRFTIEALQQGDLRLTPRLDARPPDDPDRPDR
jgi:anti-sigma factor RsiW